MLPGESQVNTSSRQRNSEWISSGSQDMARAYFNQVDLTFNAQTDGNCRGATPLCAPRCAVHAVKKPSSITVKARSANLIPQKQSLFPVSADDIVDNALQSLDEHQAREVTKKAADELVRIAVEKRKAEYCSDRAQDEMRNLISNANLLDEKVGDYKINSTFETAMGTTSVEIKKSRSSTLILIAVVALFRLLAFILLITRL